MSTTQPALLVSYLDCSKSRSWGQTDWNWVPGLIPMAGNAFRALCVCPQCIAPCFAKQQLVCLTGSLKAFKQVSEVAESEFALEPSSGVLLHGNPHPAFTSGHLLPYCAQQRQTDTYLKGPLYNKGNCNFIKKIILPKVVQRMIVGGSGRHLHSLESHLPTHPQ